MEHCSVWLTLASLTRERRTNTHHAEQNAQHGIIMDGWRIALGRSAVVRHCSECIRIQRKPLTGIKLIQLRAAITPYIRLH